MKKIYNNLFSNKLPITDFYYHFLYWETKEKQNYMIEAQLRRGWTYPDRPQLLSPIF